MWLSISTTDVTQSIIPSIRSLAQSRWLDMTATCRGDWSYMSTVLGLQSWSSRYCSMSRWSEMHALDISIRLWHPSLFYTVQNIVLRGHSCFESWFKCDTIDFFSVELVNYLYFNINCYEKTKQTNRVIFFYFWENTVLSYGWQLEDFDSFSE